MRWKPTTHAIDFLFEDTPEGYVCVSFVGDPVYNDRDPQEVYEEVLSENNAINLMMAEE